MPDSLQEYFSSDGFECNDIRWDLPTRSSIQDCLLLSNLTRFYGGGLKKFQTWPADLQPLLSQSITPSFSNSNTDYLGLAVPFFAFSTGIVIKLSTRNEVFLDWKGGGGKRNEFCFGVNGRETSPLDLSKQIHSYSICSGKDIAHVTKNAIAK